MDQPEFKFQNICRACKIENSEMCSIYERDLIDNSISTSLTITPADMLMACTSVKVNSQNLFTFLISTLQWGTFMNFYFSNWEILSVCNSKIE